MELKEAIKILEEFLLILGSEYCYIDNRDTTKEEQAMETVLKYIKEESIPRAVVEEKIEELNEILIGLDYHDIEDKEEREFYKKEYMKYVCARNEVQGILNKGESDEN